MIFPNTRKDDYYNQEFLNKNDKEVITGYDYAVEAALNLFDNLNAYQEELNDMLEEDDNPIFKVLNFYAIIEEKSNTIQNIVRDWLENGRDDLITSMIDNMDENEYETNRNKYFAEHPDSDFYDTRNFSEVCKHARENE
jgi:hypothetical protein